MGSRARAILWAQFRTVVNHLPRSSKVSLAFSTVLGIFWYGSFLALAIAAAFVMSNARELEVIAKILPGGLLLAFLYWQVVPLLLVSTGSALEVKKLAAYPIPKGELFGLEVMMRVTTGIETVMVLTGAAIGLFLNPRIPNWAPFSLAVFTAFNLLLSAGVRDLLARLFARKVLRELLVFLFVIAAALPQLVLLSRVGHKLKGITGPLSALPWPWTVTAALALGHFTWTNAAALLLWTTAGYWFGRWQFERSLRFDEDETSATRETAGQARSRFEGVFRLPGVLFADPIGAMIEKEFRFLSRSARFRLVFIMGFSFGLLIWLPMTFGQAGSSDSWIGHNYLALLSAYALLLLSDTLFWNVFGFDRSAAQVYFVSPVKIATVLRAKNLAAAAFILLEVTIITVVCLVLHFPVSTVKVGEAYAVTLTIALYLMSIGNLSSTYNPKAADPAKSFRSGAGRQTQAALIFFFPLALMPALLAYAARYAFRSEPAFFGVLLFSAVLGAVVYRIALQSAEALAEERKEAIIMALSGGESPIAS